ncbi:MAG: hypothetical protein J6W80_06435 [Kiritimatiellae bacterium]|nr:hypothetical protein [Kiritimatiellia bacterium]
MKILLLAAEESALIYASEIKRRLAGHEILGYQDFGFKTSDLAVMGFGPILRKLFYFLHVKRTMCWAIDEWKPDVCVTIDYPGMNLAIQRHAKKRGVRAVHVVCPQIWAWRAGRVRKIEASLDRLCCFLPFEPQMFKPGFATFTGHPLAENFPKRGERDVSLVAFLPGSRIGEIKRNLPTMLEAAASLRNSTIVIPAANEEAYVAIDAMTAGRVRDYQDLRIQMGGARELLLRANVAVVASGTATLEAALARCPTILVYRVNPLLAMFARRVIKGVKHIGLANIIWEKSGGSGEAPMPEFLQENFTAANVVERVLRWHDNDEEREKAVKALDAAVRPLEGDGNAFGRIVDEILAVR